jgi:hypothetical protein
MADVKLGIMLGILETDSMAEFENFVEGLRPAAFKVENQLRDASEMECDKTCAKIVSRILPELVRVNPQVWEENSD